MREILKAESEGEAIMKEALSLLVDSRVFLDNASPSFLVNPDTGEQLEFDRYYPKDDVAFEFNGAQHYVATERYDEEAVRKQRLRDAAKRDICAREGIDLVVVRPQDLSLTTMLQKIGKLLPLRNLLGAKPLIDYLESECAAYRRNCPTVGPG